MLTHATAEEIRAGGLPDQLARQRRGGADLPDQLPLRAGVGRGRPHHRGAGQHPQPGRRRRLLVAGARPARGAGHRADPQPAQEPARQLRARAQHGPRVPGRRRRRGRSRSSTRSSATSARPPASSSPARRGTGRGCPAHLQPTFRVVGDDGSEAARGKDLESLKEPLRPSLAQAIADVAADSGVSATGQTSWTFGTIEESFVQRRAGPRGARPPGARRRGRHRRAPGRRVGGGGRGAAPARRTPPAPARPRAGAVGGPARARPAGQARAGRVAVPLRRRARRGRARRDRRGRRRRPSAGARRGGVRRAAGRGAPRPRRRRAGRDPRRDPGARRLARGRQGAVGPGRADAPCRP